MRRHFLRAVLALALCLLVGCESAAVKCKKARAAAHDNWAAYVGALEGVREAASKTQARVHQQMTTVVEPRLLPEAQKLADARYDRSSEAWLRASKTAFTELCSKDQECNALREQRMQANATQGDMDERLPLATAARDAQSGEVAAALDASKGAVIDPERPALKAAQQLTLALAERCEGVPLEAEPVSLEDKLERWRDAGLIDAAAVERIAAFEDSRRRPVALYALAALGAGTVALGLVSLVAANWDVIPAHLKLGCDLVLGSALAVATHAAVRKQWTLATEVLVTIFYGFTLASLALVGQVYQLDTPTWQALLVWTASTLPLVLLARTRYVAALSAIGLVTTHGFAFEALFDHLEELARHGSRDPANVMASLLYLSPLAYVALGRQPWLLRERPEHARTLAELGFLGLLFGGFGIGFVWYDSRDGAPELSWSLLVAAALSAAFVAALPKLYATGAQLQRSLGAALAIAFVTLALGTTFERPELAFVGALAQIAFLAALAWASVQARFLRVFNALTGAIALRILAVYFEVFHSLLSTGLGLITGGALTLLLAWLWRGRAQALAKRLSQPPAAGPGPAAGGDAHA